MSNFKPTQVITGKARLSFTHLFTPYAHQAGQEPKYSVTILVPKTDAATKQAVDTAIAAAKQEGLAGKWGGAVPPVCPIPVYDGDGTRPNGEAFGEECKGHWVFTASSKQAPQVVDAQVNPVLDQSEIYSGIYGRVSVNFFSYFAAGRKGIGCGLNNVQKLADGEPLGGRTSAADDFGTAQPAPSYGVAQQTMQHATPNYGGAQGMSQQAPAIDPVTGMPVA